MNSALYSGWITHRRFAPCRHAFRYRIGLLYLDLTEQETVLGLSPLAGRSRFAPFSFRERDYLKAFSQPGERLSDAVRRQVGLAIGHEPQGAIHLLTQPRSFGLAFNPVSFFYCHEPCGRLAAILCEVSNTPWRERYHYVLPARSDDPPDSHRHFTVAKAFHVSPFLPPDLEYRMSFSPVGEALGVHMADWQDGRKLFDATLDLHRETLDRHSLHRHLRRFPWMTGKTAVTIYWQALRLLLKRAPLFTYHAADGHMRTATLPAEEHRHEVP
ncbi:DUF1365 domain-containing protein [Pseudomonas sp. B11(2017)]|uniref:DUF1365 domain-containing protein n=1 Tax=Pseudomonas sp. B11(2017) TaxID=1981748 RepID=UPI000A1E531C|nr:DUF1365 domain-containing protein [Pseudomonas sp. B11(2017)]